MPKGNWPGLKDGELLRVMETKDADRDDVESLRRFDDSMNLTADPKKLISLTVLESTHTKLP